MRARVLTWIHRSTSLIRLFLAIQRREIVRLHTVSALERLDDRVLTDIGVPRGEIAEYAREVAHRAVPVAPMPTSGRRSVLARLRSWWERRATIRELSSLDDRLLRDIGIEPGQIGDVVDAVLSQRHDRGTAHPVVELSEAMQEVLVPARYRPGVPAMPFSDSTTPMHNGNRATIRAERTPDVHALRARAANESQSPESRRRASAGM